MRFRGLAPPATVVPALRAFGGRRVAGGEEFMIYDLRFRIFDFGEGRAVSGARRRIEAAAWGQAALPAVGTSPAFPHSKDGVRF